MPVEEKKTKKVAPEQKPVAPAPEKKAAPKKKAEKKPEAKEPVKASPKATPKGELVEETLPIDLTEEEKMVVAEKISAVHEKICTKEEKLKEIKQEKGAEIKTLRAEFNEEMKKFKEGTEMRAVTATKVITGDKCAFWFDGKIVFERPVNDKDKQSKFPFLRKAKENGNGKTDWKAKQAGMDLDEVSASA